MRLRALLFDAGNTLIRMDYDAIARRLAASGVVATARTVQRAEWRARVRLDDEVLAGARPGTSTESGAVGERYARYVLAGESREGGWRELARGTTIGYAKLERFPPAPLNRIRLTIEEAVTPPEPLAIKVY